MPKRLAFFAISFLFLLALIAPAHALLDNEVDKAKEFMKAGMYPQAIELLNKRIKDKPTDAEAHFQLGICYLNNGNYGGAEERFASAVRLKSDYGYKIGEEFKKAGSAAADKKQVQQAQGLFAKAVQYQPNLKGTIANEMFSKGESSIGQGRTADAYFDLAVQYDLGLKDKVCDAYYNKGKSSSGDMQAGYYQQALRYCTKYGEEIKAALCDFYFEKGKSAEKDGLKYFQEAKNYGNKHDREIGQFLLANANKLPSATERQRYIESIAKQVSEEQILKSSIEYWSSVWGEPQKIELKEKKFEHAGIVAGRKNVRYLSISNFWMKSEKSNELWSAQIINGLGRKMMYSDMEGKDTPIYFQMNERPTTVYYWIEK